MCSPPTRTLWGGQVDEQEQGYQEVGTHLAQIGRQFRVDEHVRVEEGVEQEQDEQEDPDAGYEGVSHVFPGVRCVFARDEVEDTLDHPHGEQGCETDGQDAVPVGRQVFRVEEMRDDDRLENLEYAGGQQRGVE